MLLFLSRHLTIYLSLLLFILTQNNRYNLLRRQPVLHLCFLLPVLGVVLFLSLQKLCILGVQVPDAGQLLQVSFIESLLGRFVEGQSLPVGFKIHLAESAGFIILIDVPRFDVVQYMPPQHRNLGKAGFVRPDRVFQFFQMLN